MWMVRAGRNADLIGEFLSEGVVAIGWSKAGQIPNDVSDEELRRRFDEAFAHDRPTARLVWRRMVKQFLNGMQVGDEVVTYDPSERRYHLGRLDSEAAWRDASYPRYRQVRWLKQISRDALSVKARNGLGSISTLFRINDEVAQEIHAQAVGAPAPLRPSTAPDEEEDLSGEAPTTSESLREEMLQKSEQFIEDKLARLDWSQMQQVVAAILRAMRYQTTVSPPGSDRGLDISASPDGLGLEQPRICVEVKHRRGSTGADEIRSFLGGRRPGDTCLYVSTGGFTKDARYEAERANVPLKLLNMEGLRALFLQHYESLDAAAQAMVPLQRLYWPLNDDD